MNLLLMESAVPHRIPRALHVRLLPALLATLAGLTACGGGDSTTDVTPPPGTPGTLAVAISAGSGGTTGAGTVSTVVTITRGGSFSGAVSLTAEGAPAGVTASFAPASLATGNTSTLDLTVAASAAPGTYQITVRATGSGVSAATASYTLTISAPATPDFSVAIAPGALTVEEGQSGTATITITRTGGFTGALGIVVTGEPADVQATVTPASITGTTATLTISAQLGAPAGTYPLEIVANENGPRSRSTPLTLVITPRPVAGSLTLSPASITVTQGQQTAPITVALVRGAGVTGDAQFSIENLPQFVTATFTPNPASGNSATLTLNAGINHSPGTITLVVRATVGATSSTATLVFTTSQFTPPDFAISLTPSAVSLTAGNGATSDIEVERTAGFDGEVAFTVTGAPAGVSATVAPSTTTGNSATVTLSSTAGAAPGVYPLLVSATGVGVATPRTATLSLTVNSPGSGGNVQWRFCGPSRVPVWFGVRAGTSGAWTRVTEGANRTYAFPFAAIGQVAYVIPSAAGFDLTVLHLTPAEALPAAAAECTTSVPTVAVSGTVTGVAAPRSAIVVMGGATTFVDAPQTAYTLPIVQNRVTDLLAFRGFRGEGDFQSYERAIIRRNIDPATASTQPVLDFEGMEWVPGVGRNSFWAGFGTDPFLVTTSLITSNGFVGTFQYSSPSLDDVRGIAALPDAAREASDLYNVVAATTNQSASRQIIMYARNILLSGVHSFGPLLSTPTVTAIGGGRVRVQGTWQPEYDRAIGVSFVQGASNTRSVTLSGSSAVFGSSGFTVEVPDFTGAPGWNPLWMLQPGVLSEWSVSGSGLASGSALTPADGVKILSAQRAGTITP